MSVRQKIERRAYLESKRQPKTQVENAKIHRIMSNDDSLILSKINTRESSTVAFATLAVSSSLVVLALLMQNQISKQYSWVEWIGLAFALIGVIYREISIFLIDRPEFGSLSFHTQALLKRGGTTGNRNKRLGKQ